MAFSSAERNRRDGEMRGVMERLALKCLVLFGEVNVGNDWYGDLRYYTDHRNVANRQVAMLFLGSPPALFVASPLQQPTAARRSSISDCRASENMPADMVNLLKERGVTTGKVGVSFEVLPVNWYNYLRGALPGVEWVETHSHVVDLRFRHSPEEAALFRRCAPLADGGYEAALQAITPGVSEYEIASAIEAYARSRGAEQHFTLIGSGRFALGDLNGLPKPYAPSHRRIETGDSVVMEITPCLEGYWTQLVRAVNVGRPNPELEALYRVARDSTRAGLEFLRPGNTIADVVLAIIAHIEGCGYRPQPPFGHTCGVDLNEARLSPANGQPLQPGLAVIIHPTVVTPDGKSSFFWGETYLVTDEGYERLNRATDELLTT